MVAVEILPVHPPGEVEEQLLEDPGEEEPVASAAGVRDLVDPPGGPGVDGRVDVREGELVRRDLAVGMHVPLAEEKEELFLGEKRIDLRERDHVEGQVPRRVPGVLPLVRHGEDVPVVEMGPVAVPAVPAARGRRRKGGVPLEPILDGEVVELLRPEEPGVALPRDAALLPGQVPREEGGIVVVRLPDPIREHPVEPVSERFHRRLVLRGQAKAEGDSGARGDLQPVQRARLRPRFLRVHRIASALDDVLVEGVLDVRRTVGRVEQPRRVRLVLREQEPGRPPLRPGVGGETEPAEGGVLREERTFAGVTDPRLRPVPFPRAPPGPGVPEPEGRQEIERGRLGPAVGRGHPDQDVVRGSFRVLRDDIEISPSVEDAGVPHLEFPLDLRSPAGSPRPGGRTEMPPGEVCKGPSYRSGWASSRGRSTPP